MSGAVLVRRSKGALSGRAQGVKKDPKKFAHLPLRVVGATLAVALKRVQPSLMDGAVHVVVADPELFLDLTEMEQAT